MKIVHNNRIVNDILFSKGEDVMGAFFPTYLLIKYGRKTLDWKKHGSLYQSTSIHETIHWHQYMGTTWGCFCTIINQCRTDEFINNNHYFNLKKTLNEVRKISINPDFSIKHNWFSVSGKTRDFTINWLASTLTSKFFQDGGVNYIQLKKLQEYFSYGMTDYIITVSEFFNIEIPNSVQEIEKLFMFDDFSFLKHDGELISILDLLEGQAKANDLISSNYMAVIDDESEFDKKFLNNSSIPLVYRKALRLYLRYNSTNRLIEDLAKFSVIVNIALSIPIPPFTAFSYLKEISWKEIFPPYRFLILCDEAIELEFKFNIDDFNTSSREFASELCKRLNYKSPYELSEYFINKHSKKINHLNEKWNINGFNTSNLRHINEYFFYVFSKFQKLKLKNETISSHYGFGISGFEKDLPKYTEVVLFQGDEGNHWYYPPFEIRDNDELLSGLIEKRKGMKEWLVHWILHNKILNEFILFNRKIDPNYFIFNLTLEMKDAISSLFKAQYDIELEWK